jgi:hypothetical protein
VSLINANEYDLNNNKVINNAFFPHMVLKPIKKDKQDTKYDKHGIILRLINRSVKDPAEESQRVS